MKTTKPTRKTGPRPVVRPADARRRRLEAEVKRILAERDPGELLAEMRAHLDEVPRDQLEFQQELLAVASARYVELTRGRRG
ncbi:MAG: hypothetical protein JXB32_23410 [Deltaproteobacteria bacterium]|nr:hypothetical protein [Deltaproteobacteria bacterium]